MKCKLGQYRDICSGFRGVLPARSQGKNAWKRNWKLLEGVAFRLYRVKKPWKNMELPRYLGYLGIISRLHRESFLTSLRIASKETWKRGSEKGGT